MPCRCTLCPRACGANRLAGQRGYCGADGRLLVARAALHHWEEPPISGSQGSGTVFFSNCPLGCVYCQNKPIASGQAGRAVSVQRLAEIFSELQAQGAHNINLVTASHYQPQCIDAIKLARSSGMTLPIVYNTSGYESLSAISQLQGHVDIYLTDFKYASPKLAQRYSNAPDYPAVALAALKAMVAQAGEYRLEADGADGAAAATPSAAAGQAASADGAAEVGAASHAAAAGQAASGGLLRQGVIVRHLLLPGQLNDAKQVLQTVFAAVGNSVCYSLMSQYTPPPPESPAVAAFPELQQKVAPADYDELINFAIDLGIKHSFMQTGETASESYIPAFDLTGV